MLALALPLLAAAAPPPPVLVIREADLGAWAVLDAPPAEVARVAALPGAGPWVGTGPYARDVPVDGLGGLAIGSAFATTRLDGAPVGCTVTGFGLLDLARDGGARVGDGAEGRGCSSPTLAARLTCAGDPGPIGSPGLGAPRLYAEAPANEREREAAVATLRAEIDALLAPAPAAYSEARATRWTWQGRRLLLLTVEAWEGPREREPGSDAFRAAGWGLLADGGDDYALAIPFQAQPGGPLAEPVALVATHRPGAPDVLVDADGLRLIGPDGAVLREAPILDCSCGQ